MKTSPPNDPEVNAWLALAAQGDQQILGKLLEQDRERLRRMVTLRLVDRRTGAELAQLRLGENERLYPRRFSPDGSSLYVWGQQTNLLYVWDLRLLRERLEECGLDWDLPPYPPPQVHETGMRKVVFDLGPGR